MDPAYSRPAERLVDASLAGARAVIDRLRLDTGSLTAAAAAIRAAVMANGKVLTFGNGGSAAIADHLVTELVGRFSRERAPLPAVCLCASASAATAIANDYGFDEVFSRQVESIARPGDVVIAFTTSGSSANVLRAVEKARSLGVTSVAFVGARPTPLASVADICVAAPSLLVARIQEAHLLTVHVLMELLEAAEDTTDAAPVYAPSHEIVSNEELLALRDVWRTSGKTVVTTNGCFDLLHDGHVHTLEFAKAQGDILVVGLNSDRTVKMLKGPERPVIPFAQRARLVAALDPVNCVVELDETLPLAFLDRVRPDVHCKGGDYSTADLPEAEVVLGAGGRVVITPYLEGRSTSSLLARLRAQTS